MVIAPLRAWMELLPAPAEFAERSLRLAPGTEIDPDELRRRLVDSRYRLVSLVESLGEFAVRGGILDVFPPTREHPVRIEFFGDQVESLREFNPRDQRSMRLIDSIELPPASTRSVPLEDVAHGGDADDGVLTATLADYLDDPVWVELEPEILDSDGREWMRALDEHYHQALASDPDAALPERLVAEPDVAIRRGDAMPGRIEVRELAGMGGDGEIDLRAQAAPAYRGRLAELAERLHRDLPTGERVAFLFDRDGKAQRLAEILSGYEVPVAASADAEAIEPGAAWIGPGNISAGFRVPEVGLWVGCDAEIFGRARPVGRSRRFHGDTFQADFRDLAPGDLVVHEEHGIGRFASVQQIDVDGSVREFMEIEYRGTDRLYVPLDQLYLVQKFRAGEDTKPKIDRLGSTSWRKVKSRVKRSLQEMASDLLELYAARKASYGHPFGEDTPWQRELEEAFEYDETPDQLTAIAEVKADMEAPEVMDRLLCGDVGYGKTEVAMRAAFKAIMDGKQVAMLAPTTVLAHQHWQTLRQRFAPFPVRVELLSRFRDRAQQKVTTDGLASGEVDMVVGTHRLLSGDVRFKDLGLLIVDEE
ncbi:MAG: CarD family transcriptional regulator, partial [Thermoanaerobaculia bacterium]|nr:CarD family transcriptional regulator [Thermoanaerobaculia bacterium]